MDALRQVAEQLLQWVGFGTLVGLLAKAIFPGKDPGGTLATVIIGILGSVIGAGTLVFFSDSLRVTPISPLGFLVAICGTSIILFSYRLLSGNFVKSLTATEKKPRRKVTVTEQEVA